MIFLYCALFVGQWQQENIFLAAHVRQPIYIIAASDVIEKDLVIIKNPALAESNVYVKQVFCRVTLSCRQSGYKNGKCTLAFGMYMCESM